MTTLSPLQSPAIDYAGFVDQARHRAEQADQAVAQDLAVAEHSRTDGQHVARAPLAADLSACPDVRTRLLQSDAARKVEAKIHALVDKYKLDTQGENADYISALRTRDTKDFGVSMVSRDGGQLSFGQARVPFTIQSVSKPIGLALALDAIGENQVDRRVGQQLSPHPFNHPTTVGFARQPLTEDTAKQAAELMELKKPDTAHELKTALESFHDARPANALSNFGAITLAGHIAPAHTAHAASHPVAKLATTMTLIKNMGRAGEDGKPIADIDFNVLRSEITDSAGNQALARVAAMQENERKAVRQSPGEVLAHANHTNDVYISGCAIRMHAAGLATLYATVANQGVNPFTHQRAMPRADATKMLEEMKVGGMYEVSEDFTRKTGLIAKSGVGGGIVAIDPVTRLTFCTYSTPLNGQGNSHRGVEFLRELATSDEYLALRASVRGDTATPDSALRQFSA